MRGRDLPPRLAVEVVSVARRSFTRGPTVLVLVEVIYVQTIGHIGIEGHRTSERLRRGVIARHFDEIYSSQARLYRLAHRYRAMSQPRQWTNHLAGCA